MWRALYFEPQAFVRLMTWVIMGWERWKKWYFFLLLLDSKQGIFKFLSEYESTLIEKNLQAIWSLWWFWPPSTNGTRSTCCWWCWPSRTVFSSCSIWWTRATSTGFSSPNCPIPLGTWVCSRSFSIRSSISPWVRAFTWSWPLHSTDIRPFVIRCCTGETRFSSPIHHQSLLGRVLTQMRFISEYTNIKSD